MTTPRLIVAGLAAALTLTGCSKKHSSLAAGDPDAPVSDFDQLTNSLIGTFTNAEQAEELGPDGKPVWMNVELHIVEIHPPRYMLTELGAESLDRWFYIEQAEVGALDTPYRQHVSMVRENPSGGFISLPYTFTGDPLRFTNWWKHPESFMHHFGPEDLVAHPGCEIEVRPQGDGRFAGGTVGTGCANGSKGASHATSQVIISPTEIRAWDRGYNAAGRQVWGSTTGPYILVKE